MSNGDAGSDFPTFALYVMSAGGVAVHDLPARGEVALGRSPECEIPIADGKLSRRHAVVRTGERVTITDVGSANGTVVDGVRIAANEETPIGPASHVIVGTTVIALQPAARGGDARRWLSPEELEGRARELAARRVEPVILRVRLRWDDARWANAPTAESSDVLRHARRLDQVERALFDVLGDDDAATATAPDDHRVLFAGDAGGRVAAASTKLHALVSALGATVVITREESVPAASPAATPARAASSPSSPPSPSAPPPPGFLGRMASMLDRVAAGTISVLVLGETGAGKEVLAHAIHARSPRKGGPMLSINCAALSETLLASELFGYEKGAFTGAAQAKAGLLESAQGGTVFLDEVGEMPLDLQAKLLRVLEQREVLRVGSLRPRPIDVRFVAATNRDLVAEVRGGRFRQDLYFRLNGVSLTVPPLRDRKDEVLPLARRFLAEASAALARTTPTLAPTAEQALLAHDWPGNIRELRNAMERTAVLCEADVVGAEHLALSPGDAPDVMGTQGDERARILAALAACAGNQTQAAKRLGVSRRTLVSRLAEYDVPRPRKR